VLLAFLAFRPAVVVVLVIPVVLLMTSVAFGTLSRAALTAA